MSFPICTVTENLLVNKLDAESGLIAALNVDTINGNPYTPGGITIENNTSNTNQVVLFQTTAGSTSTVNSNSGLLYNPSIQTLYPTNIQTITGTTIYLSNAIPVYAAALQGGILQNGYTGVSAITWTLDTSSNITTAFQPNGFGSTFEVFVCNPQSLQITIAAGDGSTTVINGTSIAGASLQ